VGRLGVQTARFPRPMGRNVASTFQRGGQRVLHHPPHFRVRKQTKELIRCPENTCAEGALECGSASYRLSFGFQGGSSAAALQGAARIFVVSGRLSADGHERLPNKWERLNKTCCPAAPKGQNTLAFQRGSVYVRDKPESKMRIPWTRVEF